MTKITNIGRYCATLFFACGILSLTAPAIASPAQTASDNDELPHATLNTASTDFTSPKAVNSLTKRVRRVAYEICVPNGNRWIDISRDERKCYETAINSVTSQIESKRLLALGQTSVRMAAVLVDTKPLVDAKAPR